VRLIQQMRKDKDLNITDRINLEIATESEKLKAAISGFEDYIKEQTLGVAIAVNENQPFGAEQKIDGEILNIEINKA